MMTKMEWPTARRPGRRRAARRMRPHWAARYVRFVRAAARVASTSAERSQAFVLPGQSRSDSGGALPALSPEPAQTRAQNAEAAGGRDDAGLGEDGLGRPQRETRDQIDHGHHEPERAHPLCHLGRQGRVSASRKS